MDGNVTVSPHPNGGRPPKLWKMFTLSRAEYNRQSQRIAIFMFIIPFEVPRLSADDGGLRVTSELMPIIAGHLIPYALEL